MKSHILYLTTIVALCISTCVASTITPAQKALFQKAQKTGLPYEKFSDSLTFGNCLCLLKATVCKETARDMGLITLITASQTDKRDALIAFVDDKPENISSVNHNDIKKATLFAYTKDKMALKKIRTSGNPKEKYIDVYIILQKEKLGSPYNKYPLHSWQDVLYSEEGKNECAAYTLKCVVLADEYENAFPSKVEKNNTRKDSSDQNANLVPSTISPTIWKNTQEGSIVFNADIKLSSVFRSSFGEKKKSFWSVEIHAKNSKGNWTESFFGYALRNSDIGKRIASNLADGDSHPAIIKVSPVDGEDDEDITKIEDFKIIENTENCK